MHFSDTVILPGGGGGREEEEEEVCLDTTRGEEAMQENRRLREQWGEAATPTQGEFTSHLTSHNSNLT